MIASVILDIEPLAVIIFDLPMPLHGFLHSYLGASIIACILAIVIYPFRSHLNEFVNLFGFHQKSSLRHIIPASLIGVYSHVFLDSFIYPEMNPFYPFIGNPFLGILSTSFVYSLCIQLGLLGLGLYIIRLLYLHLKPEPIRKGQDVFSDT